MVNDQLAFITHLGQNLTNNIKFQNKTYFGLDLTNLLQYRRHLDLLSSELVMG